MRTTKEVENEMNDCEKKIQEFKERKKELAIELMEIKYSKKFPIGRDVLIDGEKYKIIRYDYRCFGEVIISNYKKDGSLSKRERQMYYSDQEKAVLI